MKSNLENNNVLVEVKFLKSHSRLAYSAGNIGFVSSEAAQILKKGGYIKFITDEDLDTLAIRLRLGKKVTRVKWLRANPNFAYSAGNISYLTPDTAVELITEKFVKEISESYKDPEPEKVILTEADWVKVFFLKPAPGYAHPENTIAKIVKTSVKALLDGGYIALVPDDYVEDVPEAATVSNLEIEVIFLRNHPKFSYSPGNITKVTKEDAKMLFAEKYVDFFSEDLKVRNEIYKGLGIVLEKRIPPAKRT